MENKIKIKSDFRPAGDQPFAIEKLVQGIQENERWQTLLGVTGSGKTFTMANVFEAIQRPVLVITHNKTLGAQLYSEFKNFFPDNAVEYFVSYYDYYLPEAYIPQTDTYIAKDASINDEIDKLRLAATSSLVERRDVIIVASVSCIYGLGSPDDFAERSIFIKANLDCSRQEFLRRLVELLYERNDIDRNKRGTFRVSGDTIDIRLAHSDELMRVEFWGDTIEKITCRDPLSCDLLSTMDSIRIFPAKHFLLPEDRFRVAKADILEELKEQVRKFEKRGRLVEAQRIFQRTNYDLEMMQELGYCSGIENYSRHLSRREAGSRPYSLLDYFPKDFITIIDESHATIPQIRGMYFADRSRKSTLVEHGFRLPSALDNRPLNFDEFSEMTGQMVFVSATPGPYELQHSTPIQQVVRPTGLLDPRILIRPLEGQVDDLIHEIRETAKKDEKILVTTLTKRMAEDLTDYLQEIGIRVKYIHSEIDAIERVEILRELRMGDFDCLVGINLLREGLDLPEVSLVAILDADKEGFLRSRTSLTQTAGRAARNANGRVILYADEQTDSIQELVNLTKERRERQKEYNECNGIIPKTVRRAVQESLYSAEKLAKKKTPVLYETTDGFEIEEVIRNLETEMIQAAEKLEFERAAMLRDQIKKLEKSKSTDKSISKSVKY